MQSPKRIKRFVAAIVLGIILFAGGRVFIFWRIREIMMQRIEKLQTEGFHIQYKSLDVSAWTSSIRMMEVEIKLPAPDSSCASTASVPQIRIEGISLLPVLLRKRLSLHSILLDHPSFHYTKNFTGKRQENARKNFLKEIKIDNIRIDSGSFETLDSTNCTSNFRATLNFTVNDLTIRKPGQDSATWSLTTAGATDITIELPTRFYKASVKQVVFSQANGLIRLDSLQVAPTLDRLTFARETGHQADQFTCSLPILEIRDVEIGPSFQPSFYARYVEFNFKLAAYRDKRFPRVKRKPRIMPVQFLQNLPFHLQIDSIRLAPSTITYEEFPEAGTETGRISFNNVEAGISNLSNDSSREARMTVNSRFMNAGDLHADFTFPGNPKKHYAVNGALSNFSMPEINGMLVPVGSIKIESGVLKQMKFNFHYDSFQSLGKLEINYHDLKVLSLRKDEDKSINKLVSLLISIFVKKDIDKGDTKEDRTGDIHWERDTQKGILNYWWKSILSGLKSVYNLDKLTGKENKQKSK